MLYKGTPQMAISYSQDAICLIIRYLLNKTHPLMWLPSRGPLRDSYQYTPQKAPPRWPTPTLKML